MSSESYRQVLEPLLFAAGELAMRHFRLVQAEMKPDGTQVTAADREVEQLLVEALGSHYPNAAIRSEEGGAREGSAGCWYIDPIDGTSSFLEGLAHWGPTVCFVEDGRLQVGVFWQPRLAEFWYAERGAGAWRGDVRLVAREPQVPEREQSLCVPSRFHRVGPAPWPGKVRALGSSAAHLALVASGAAAAAVVPQWSLWDVGCGALLLDEAGYDVRDLAGRAVNVATCAPGLPLVVGAPNAVRHLFRDQWAEGALNRTAANAERPR